MFQRLLICTDFADGLQRMARFTSSFAAAGVQQVTFLHSVPLDEKGRIPRVDTEGIDRARQRLAIATETAPENLDVQVVVDCGRPTELILKTARDQRSDLLIVGVSARAALAEKFFGSTSRALYEQTKIPVLSFRAQLISTYTSEELDLRCRHLFRDLMIPYDGTAAANAVIEQIKTLTGQNQAETVRSCRLCRVTDAAPRQGIPQATIAQTAEHSMATAQADLAAIGIQVYTEVRQGEAVSEILGACTDPDISAIVTSTNSRSRLSQLSVPSFAQGLLQKSWHPILFFPAAH
jgi:nucleotide-binding universal stress UspA family protein